MRVAELGAVQAPLTLTERPTPEPGPGDVLVKVTACGMCYSEVNLRNGEYPFARFPVVPGHEVTGVVAALGSPHDLRDTLAFAAAHGILPEVTPVSLDQAPGILASMAAGTARGRGVIAF